MALDNEPERLESYTKDGQVIVYLTRSQKIRVREIAQARDDSISKYARKAIMEAVKRDETGRRA